MALKLVHSSKDLLENPSIDTDFSIDEELKTLAFYDHNSEKKVFDIHHYGDGKRIYVKKNLGPKKFGSNKILVQTFWSKNFVEKCGSKNICFK